METHMIFETHAHYDDEAFGADREEVLNSMNANGIGRIVNACASIESLKDAEALMEKYPFVYGAFGIHPDDTDKMTEETLDDAEKSVNAYNTLKDWGAQIILGSVTSAPCIAVSEKTKADNMFQITPSGTAKVP